MKYIHFPAGETMEPIEIVFNYDFGNDVDYPFDQYSGYFEIMASQTGNISATIPISFKLEASVTTYSFNPTLRQFNYVTDKIGLKIVAGRSTTTLGFILRGRRVDAHSTMLGITMLFALPALRSAQPGIPPVGCAADILGFYWNMAIIACSAVAITMCWAVRWRAEANDTMSIMSIEEARYDDTRYDDNATACGSTCPPVRRCADNADDDIYEIGDGDSTTIAASSPSTPPDRRRQY
ncbi:F-box only protein 9 [Umbelopsis sp. WA50703]